MFPVSNSNIIPVSLRWWSITWHSPHSHSHGNSRMSDSSWYNVPTDCVHKYEGRRGGRGRCQGCPITLSWGNCTTAVGVSINGFKPEQISGVKHGASERYLIHSHGRVGAAVSFTWHWRVSVSCLCLLLFCFQNLNSAYVSVTCYSMGTY